MGEIGAVFMVITIAVLLALSAFFSGSETALMAISRLRLKHVAETRPVRAKLVQRILAEPEKLIGTILLGNNLVNVAMSALATAFAISIWGDRGIIYVTGILTVAILIFAEITPKVYAKYFNERVSFVTAPILNVIIILFNPFVAVVTYISNRLLYLIGIDVSKVEHPVMTEEEILTCIKMGWGDGAITSEERSMLSRVFTLNDKTVGEIMIPKEKMIILNADAAIEEIHKVILRTGHTRFPIRKGPDGDIIGFIHAKDLFQFTDKKSPDFVKEIIRPAYFVSPNKAIDAQLRAFQARKLHQAVVKDEAGKVAGLITLEDIIEELVGSIQDEHD
ncbi:MAG: CNNM domain-containing protein [Desulfatiglans sp.]|jgi:Mg2+/Co2+ transporter CorB|nr:CNNM domain-containing protein [Thermodesulfobacteriota bacterium]MEE4351815.1 CNNM domain-containing protein [Desulfatiglans sp.]